MRIAYILARAPFAAQEQFVLTEGAEVVRQGDQLLFVPLRPGPSITPGTPPEAVSRSIGGSGWGPSTLAQATREAVHERGPSGIARILTAARGDEPRIEPVARNAYAVPRTLAIARILRRWRVEHVHAHFSASTATAAWIVAERLGVPWSFTAHSPTDITKRNLLVEKTRAASFARTISRHGRELLTERLPDDLHGKTTVLPMGIRAPAAAGSAAERFVEDERGDEPSLVCVARLIPAKGQDLLLDAIAMLRDERMRVRAHVVGDGPDRERLEGLARERRIEGLVRFHGYVPNPDVLAALAAGAFDACVLPSDSEGVPITLMEAMAAGVRVVATDVGGVSELVRPGAGSLVPPRDVAGLASALRRELTSAEPSRGPQIIRDEYCLSRNVERLRALFRAA